MTTEREATIKSPILSLTLAVGLLGMMGGALIAPALPALMGPFRVDEGSVGLVLGFYALTTAMALPFMGFFIDRFGRKQVVIPSLLLNGIAGPLCAIALNFPTLLLLRALQGIGIAGMAPVALTLIGDFYGGLERTKAMGMFSSTLAVGGILAPIIGGTLASLSWKFPFLVYFVSIPLAFAIWIWLPSLKKGRSRSLGEYLKPFKDALKNVRVSGVLLSNFLAFLLLYTIVTFLPILLVQRYGISEALVGILLSIQGIAVALIALQSDKIVNLISKPGIVCIGFLVSGVCLLALSLELPMILVVLPLAIFGLGRGLIQPQINTLVTEVAPEDRLGGLVSIYNIMKYIGQMSAPVILGSVIAFTNIQAAFLISGILGIGASLIISFSILK